MRKEAMIGATSAGVVLVTTAVFAGGWFFQAQTAKSQTAQALAALNASFDAHNPLVTYRAIEVGGFPTRVTVGLRDAVLHYSSESLARFLHLPATPRRAGAPLSRNAIVRDETAYVAVDPASTAQKLIVRFPFPIMHQVRIGNRTMLDTVATSADLVCRLGLPIAVPDGGAALPPFVDRDLDGGCDSRHGEMRDAKSRKLISAYDLSSWSYANAASTGLNRSIVMHADLRRLVFTAAGRAALESTLEQTVSPAQLPGARRMLASLFAEKRGAKNARLDLRYDGPVTKGGFASAGMRMQLDVDHLDYSDAFGSSTLALHLRSDDEIAGDPDALRMQSRFIAYPVSGSSLAKLGPITTNIDLAGAFVNAAKTGSTDRSLTIRRFSVDSVPYSIKASGYMHRDGDEQSADLAIDLRNADALLTKLESNVPSSATQVTAYRSYASGANRGMEAVRSMMHAFGGYPDASGHIRIRYRQAAGEPPTINGMPLMQAMMRNRR